MVPQNPNFPPTAKADFINNAVLRSYKTKELTTLIYQGIPNVNFSLWNTSKLPVVSNGKVIPCITADTIINHFQSHATDILEDKVFQNMTEVTPRLISAQNSGYYSLIPQDFEEGKLKKATDLYYRSQKLYFDILTKNQGIDTARLNIGKFYNTNKKYESIVNSLVLSNASRPSSINHKHSQQQSAQTNRASEVQVNRRDLDGNNNGYTHRRVDKLLIQCMQQNANRANKKKN